jgi:hypothetical protein
LGSIEVLTADNRCLPEVSAIMTQPPSVRTYVVKMVSGDTWRWTGDPSTLPMSGMLTLDQGTLVNMAQIESMTPTD